MKPKGLIIAVAVLAVLGGLTWWSNKKQAAAKSTDTTVKILSIPNNDFQEIRLKKGGQTLDLKGGVGKWQITEPQALPADQDAVSSMVTTLGALNADTVVEDKASDLGAYGLANPALDVQVVRKNGKTDDLMIGDETPTGSGNYAKLAGDPRVFTIASYNKTSIDKQADDLRDKRLLPSIPASSRALFSRPKVPLSNSARTMTASGRFSSPAPGAPTDRRSIRSSTA